MSNELTAKTVKSYELTIDAMNNVIKEANLVIDELANGCTLKTAKSELESFVADTANLPIGIKEAVKDASKARTKSLYIEGIDLIKGKLVESIKVAMGAIHDIKHVQKAAKKDSKTEKPELNQDELDKLAACVREAIAQSLKYHFEAGKLLSEALDMFKASGKPAKEWIAWANTACQVKKAQAYNLVKIYNDFGDVSEFKGCSMRVLNLLVHCSKDVYSKIEEQAKALAKAGKLTSKTVNKLIASVKPAPVKPATHSKQSNTVRQEDETPDNTTKAIQSSIENGQGTSMNQEDSEIKDHSKADLGTSKDKVSGTETANQTNSQMDDKDRLIAELKAQNEALQNQIAELTKAVKEGNKEQEKPARTATYLPQFEAKSPNLVLGIEATATKAEINKRYRTMAVIFNAKTCPKGAKALKAAREAMLKTAKK